MTDRRRSPSRQRERNNFVQHTLYEVIRFDKPVFVYNYPTAVKAFYMQPVDGRPEVCRSVDLLAPEGYGEIIGGSERIYDQDLLESRVAEIGLPREAYDWS